MLSSPARAPLLPPTTMPQSPQPYAVVGGTGVGVASSSRGVVLPSPATGMRVSYYRKMSTPSPMVSPVLLAPVASQSAGIDEILGGAPMSASSPHSRLYGTTSTHVALEWKQREVGRWLASVQLGKFQKMFKEHDIDGNVLFELDHASLKEMGVRLVGDRMRILMAIRKLATSRAMTSPAIVTSAPASDGDLSSPRTASDNTSITGSFQLPSQAQQSQVESPPRKSRLMRTLSMAFPRAPSILRRTNRNPQPQYAGGVTGLLGLEREYTKESVHSTASAPSSSSASPPITYLPSPPPPASSPLVKRKSKRHTKKPTPISTGFSPSLPTAQFLTSEESDAMHVAPEKVSPISALFGVFFSKESPPKMCISAPTANITSMAPPPAPPFVMSEKLETLVEEEEDTSLTLLPPCEPSPVPSATSLATSTSSTDIMAYESVRRHCIRVFSADAESHVINVSDLHSAAEVFGRVCERFHITDPKEQRLYRLGLLLTPEDLPVPLEEEQIWKICRSDPARLERDRMFFYRSSDTAAEPRMLPPQKEVFMEEDQFEADTRRMTKLAKVFGETPPSSSVITTMSAEKRRSEKSIAKAAIDRPPSQMISHHLGLFFPKTFDRLTTVVSLPLPVSRSNPSSRRSSITGTASSATEDCELRAVEQLVQKRASQDTLKRSSRFSQLSKQLARISLQEVAEISSGCSQDIDAATTETTLSSRRDSTKIGGWIQGELIGKGSYASVYYGVNASTGEIMAVKQVDLPSVHHRPNGTLEKRRAKMLAALEREIELLRTLEHVNIVQYLGSHMDERHLNVFLEYVSGGCIATILARRGWLERAEQRSYIRQTLCGLEYLHERGIVHRDIKGANILVTEQGIVKISDFGISKRVPTSTGRISTIKLETQAGNRSSALQGSVYWMAPEVVKDYRYTPKADIWSVGCLLIEMLTNCHPWPELNMMQAMFRIGKYEAPPYPETLYRKDGNDADAPVLVDFLNRCFELSYKQRADAAELRKHPFLL